MARACARSTCSSPSTSRRVRSPSQSREEDGFTVPLEVDVEAVAAVLGCGDQRRAAVRRRARTAAGRRRWPRPRRRSRCASATRSQQPAREHRDGDVRRLAARGRGLARDDLPAAVARRSGSARSRGSRRRRVGLPGLDERVGHRRALAVVDGAAQRRSRPREPRLDDGRPVVPRQADREERPDGLGGRGLRHPRTGSGPGRCPSGRRAPTRAACGRGRRRPTSRSRVRARRVEDRVLREQRVAREVHLRHQPLGERAPEDREVDVRRPPGVVVVAPRIGAGLDRHELERAVGAGEAAPEPGEVRVQRRGVLVALVAVAAGGVALPDLHERVRARAGRPASSTRPCTMIRSPSGSPSCWRVRSWSSAPTRRVPQRRAGQLRAHARELDRARAAGRAGGWTCSRGRAAPSRLQHHGQALADADADRGDAVAAAAPAQLVRERAEDARAATRRAGGRSRSRRR